MNGRYIYVVFSATPLKIGAVIRYVTHGKYNHVSLSFDPKLKTLYSYARYHKSVPFYGGFVKESPSRYKNKDKCASVFVCALPIEKEKYELIKNRIEGMEKEPHKYRYNLLSAATVPLSKRVMVPNYYTCIEFVVSVLSMAFDFVSEDRFYAIEQLRQKLAPYCVYTGSFPNIEKAKRDLYYERRLGIMRASKLTVLSQMSLLKAYINTKSN